VCARALACVCFIYTPMSWYFSRHHTQHFVPLTNCHTCTRAAAVKLPIVLESEGLVVAFEFDGT